MLKINNVTFRGGGCESCGSIGNLDSLTQASKFSSTSFKGIDEPNKLERQPKNDTFEKAALGITAVGATGAAGVGGLGYAHKAKLFNKIENQTAKDFIAKANLERASKNCYDWCSSAKNKGLEFLDSIKVKK
jgi:hypothetical protein